MTRSPSKSFESGAAILRMGGVVCGPDGVPKSRIDFKSLIPSSKPRTSRLSAFLRRFFPCELQHSIAARNAMADTVVDLFDVGTTNPSAEIRIYTEGGIDLLSTVPMGNPAFGTAVTGIAAGASLPWTDLSADDNGIAREFIAVDRDETPILTGSVDVADGEINFPQNEIAVNDIVKILSASYTAAP